ncbi:hypothetical protein EV426DRAFT_678936 [Tirmania nivea]|nr:hypothetical protein EV426DRAFT_678936 [Tirmania nivea]
MPRGNPHSGSSSRDRTLHVAERQPPLHPLIESALQVRNDILRTSFGRPECYSTGKDFLRLRLPSLTIPADRFHLDIHGMFEFLPRGAFGDIWNLITEKLFTPYGFEKLMIYGSMGSGKSYLIRSLVCFLIKSGWDVIYIPDCRTFAQQPYETLLKAFLVAFANNIKFCKRLKDCFDVNKEGFVKFLRD